MTVIKKMFQPMPWPYALAIGAFVGIAVYLWQTFVG